MLSTVYDTLHHLSYPNANWEIFPLAGFIFNPIYNTPLHPPPPTPTPFTRPPPPLAPTYTPQPHLTGVATVGTIATFSLSMFQRGETLRPAHILH